MSLALGKYRGITIAPRFVPIPQLRATSVVSEDACVPCCLRWILGVEHICYLMSELKSVPDRYVSLNRLCWLVPSVLTALDMKRPDTGHFTLSWCLAPKIPVL